MSGQSGPKTVNIENEVVLLTIGHSTRPIEESIGLLLAHGVRRLVDNLRRYL